MSLEGLSSAMQPAGEFSMEESWFPVEESWWFYNETDKREKARLDVRKDDELYIKKEELCIKNDEFCIKNKWVVYSNCCILQVQLREQRSNVLDFTIQNNKGSTAFNLSTEYKDTYPSLQCISAAIDCSRPLYKNVLPDFIERVQYLLRTSV